MEELADDVGGGGDAEDDSAEDFLPPGQQQHRVLSPATVSPRSISRNQAHSTATFPSIALAIGKVVAIVCGEEGKTSSV